MRCAIVVAAVLIVSCGGADPGTEAGPGAEGGPGADGPITVRSDDGRATLTLPRQVLPEGLDPATLTITRVEDPEAVAVYDLGPDGTELGGEATVELFVPLDEESGLLVVAHITDDDIEFPELRDVVFEDDGVRFSFPVRHFSRVRASVQGSFDASFTQPVRGADIPVGSVFDVVVRVERTGKPTVARYATYGPASAFWELRKGKARSTDGRLEPDEVSPLPDLVAVKGNTHAERTQFECDQPGEAELSYKATVEWQAPIIELADRQSLVERFQPGEIGTLKLLKGVVWGSTLVDCVAPTGTSGTSPGLDDRDQPWWIMEEREITLQLSGEACGTLAATFEDTFLVTSEDVDGEHQVTFTRKGYSTHRLIGTTKNGELSEVIRNEPERRIREELKDLKLEGDHLTGTYVQESDPCEHGEWKAEGTFP